MIKYSRGRPQKIALFTAYEEERLQAINKFWEIIDSLSWSERSALARGLHKSPCTIHNGWKYGRNLPDMDSVRATISWYENGKPIESRKRMEII